MSCGVWLQSYPKFNGGWNKLQLKSRHVWVHPSLRCNHLSRPLTRWSDDIPELCLWNKSLSYAPWTMQEVVMQLIFVLVIWVAKGFKWSIYPYCARLLHWCRDSCSKQTYRKQTVFMFLVMYYISALCSLRCFAYFTITGHMPALEQ